MSEHDDRDLLLSRALRGLTPPDHAPDFWAGVEQRLADEAPRLPRVIPGHDASGSDDAEAIMSLHPTPTPQTSRPRWLPALLASAAVVVLVAAAAAVFALRNDDEATVATDPTPAAEVSPTPPSNPATPSPEPTPAPVPAVDLMVAPVEQRTLGTGRTIGVSADGTHAYILDDDPAAGLGCEGEPGQSVWAQPIAGTADDRFLAAPTGSLGYNVAMFPGPGGRVALVSNCEEYLTSIVIATEAADHTFTDLRTVLTGEDVVFVNSTTWTPDGRLLITALGTDFEDRAVWAIDPDTGERELVDDREALAAAMLADGTLVITTTDTLIIGTEPQPYDGGGSGMTLSPDGTAVAVYGPEGLAIVDASGRRDLLTAAPVYDAAWTPAGDVLAFSMLQLGGEFDRYMVDVGDGTVSGGFDTPLWYWAGTFTPDGTSLVTTTTATDTEFPEPMAVVLRWE